jgi:hypothetical protein
MKPLRCKNFPQAMGGWMSLTAPSANPPKHRFAGSALPLFLSPPPVGAPARAGRVPRGFEHLPVRQDTPSQVAMPTFPAHVDCRYTDPRRSGHVVPAARPAWRLTLAACGACRRPWDRGGTPATSAAPTSAALTQLVFQHQEKGELPPGHAAMTVLQPHPACPIRRSAPSASRGALAACRGCRHSHGA